MSAPSEMTHDELAGGAPRERPRVLRWTTLLSLLFHVVILLLFAASFVKSCQQEPLGSENLDIDLVQPRLAPPLSVNSRLASEEGQGSSTEAGRPAGERRGGQGTEARRGAAAIARAAVKRVRVAASEEEPWEVPRPEVKKAAPAARAARAEPQLAALQRTTRAQSLVAAQPRIALAGLVTVPDLPVTSTKEQRPEDLAEHGQPGRRARAKTAKTALVLQRLFTDENLASARPPVDVVATVRQDAAERQRRNETAHEARRRGEARAERWVEEMNASSRWSRLEGDASQGPALEGQPGGAGQAKGTGVGGKARYGLHFYLSGRPVQSTRIVKPPEAIELPRVVCKVGRLDITPATVRMLVTKKGAVGLAYLKHSSSSRHFDRCAIGHARQIRFRPGVDGEGTPLDVWINVRVEPSTVGGADTVAF